MAVESPTHTGVRLEHGPPPLPESHRPLFWDVDFDTLTWEADRDFIVGRILASGSWELVLWLRRAAGDGLIRSWIESREGRGLTPQQLRFWELVLELPNVQVNRWLAGRSSGAWEQRIRR